MGRGKGWLPVVLVLCLALLVACGGGVPPVSAPDEPETSGSAEGNWGDAEDALAIPLDDEEIYDILLEWDLDELFLTDRAVWYDEYDDEDRQYICDVIFVLLDDLGVYDEEIIRPDDVRAIIEAGYEDDAFADANAWEIVCYNLGLDGAQVEDIYWQVAADRSDNPTMDGSTDNPFIGAWVSNSGRISIVSAEEVYWDTVEYRDSGTFNYIDDNMIELILTVDSYAENAGETLYYTCWINTDGSLTVADTISGDEVGVFYPEEE